MLSLNTTNKVTFNVNVFGTAATPTVRCIIGEAPGFSFPATKLEGGQYEVLIDLPKDMRLGTYPFKVEVLLNGRLFTPINHNVPVTGPEAPEAPAVTTNAAPEPAPAISPSLMATVTTEKAEPRVEAAKPVAPVMSGLKKLAATPVFTKPKPQEVRRSTISMADVANAVTAAAAKEPKAKPVTKTQVAEAITPTVPVSLIKGTVIYR
jgi:hypothetical protein